jgi:hypothetical protein
VKRLVVAAMLLGLPTTGAWAGSGPRIGLDVENGFPIDGALSLGIGFGLEFGYSIGFGVGRAIPEIGFAFYPSQTVAAPKIGGAIFLGKGVEGGAYMHGVVPFAPTFSLGATGFDAGLALDFTFVPRVDFGLHFGGQWIGDTDETIDSPDEELVFGAHVGVRFGSKKEDSPPAKDAEK